MQYDPMTYVGQVRQLILENAPYFEEYLKQSRTGLFFQRDLEDEVLRFDQKVEELLGKEEAAREGSDEEEREEARKSLEGTLGQKLRMLAFPVSWREARIEPSIFEAFEDDMFAWSPHCPS